MRFKPNVTVAAVIADGDKYLMVEEGSHDRLVINQPAGHLEKDESLIEAVCREVIEETAYEFIPEAVVGIYLYPNSTNEITYMRVCFTGAFGQHYPDQPLDEGIVRAIWMNRDELLAEPERLRSPMVIQCIDDYLAGKRFPLEMLHYADDR